MLDIKTFTLRAKDLYPKSCLQRKEVVLKQYDSFLEKNGLQPSLESLNLWIDDLLKRGLSSSTLGVYTYDVLSYFELMMLDLDERKLKLLKKRIPPRSVGEVDFLTDDEVARLITNTPSPIRRLIYALCYTYARRLGEVLALTRKDLDLENGIITFAILKKKREEKATYELEPWIKEMLLKYDNILGKERLFERTARAVEIAFKRDCKRAGIQSRGRDLRPHILRHSRITSLRNKGVPLDLVSKYVARHSRFDTTVQFYRGITEEEKVSIPKAEEIFKGVG
ncbi:MAG: site-specific integrase [Candidatus Micrarchaeaceae archaeon]